MATARFFAFGLLAACFLPGCSGSKGPATVPVTGIVNYRNTPVDGASVVFSPTSAGPTAAGMTDAQGRYTLSTGEKTGAVPGDYKVTVVKSRIEGPTMTDEERNKYVQEHEGASPPTPVSKNLLPEKYVSTQTSDLSVTVKSGENDIPLNLTD